LNLFILAGSIFLKWAASLWYLKTIH
jgi:hypothetical protein